jgi:hypothetical protein
MPKVQIQISATDNASAILRKVSAAINDTGKSADKTTSSFAKSAATIALSGAALYKISAAYQDAIMSGSKLQETQNKFDVVFRDSISQAEIFSKTLVDSYGLAKEEAMSFLSGTGDILIGMGMTSEKALELSNGVSQLGIDLASFSNVAGGSERAVAALTSALSGEREALKAYGIIVNEELIKAELLATKKDHLTGMARKQAESEATLAIAYRQSGNAVGDMERSFDSYANIQRRVDSQLADFSADIGSQLLPSMSNLGLAFLGASKDGGIFGDTVKQITEYIAETVDGIAVLMAKFDQFNSTRKLENTLDDANTLIKYNKNLIKQYGDLASLKKAAETSGAAKEELKLYEANNQAIERNIKLSQTQKEESDKKLKTLATIQDRIANGDKVNQANQTKQIASEKQATQQSIEGSKKKRDEAVKFYNEIIFNSAMAEASDLKRIDLTTQREIDSLNEKKKYLKDYQYQEALSLITYKALQEADALRLKQTSDMFAQMAAVQSQFYTNSSSEAANAWGQMSQSIVSSWQKASGEMSKIFADIAADSRKNGMTMGDGFKVGASVAVAALSSINAILSMQAQLVQANYQNQMDALQAAQNKELEMLEEKYESKNEIDEEQTNFEMEKRLLELEEYRASLDGKTDSEIEAAIKSKTTEIKAFEDSKNLQKKKDAEEKANQKKKEAEQKMINERYAMEEWKLKVAAFKSKQEADKAAVFMSAAIGVTSAWASSMSLPFPVNVAVGTSLSGLMIGTAAKQISLIGDQRPPAPPAFADGVTNFEGGWALVGERGREMVNLPSGSNVITNENTEKLLGGGAPQYIHIPIYLNGILTQEELIDTRKSASYGGY